MAGIGGGGGCVCNVRERVGDDRPPRRRPLAERKVRGGEVDDCGLVSVHRYFTPANHPKLERLVVSGNPGLDAKARAQVDAFAATTTKNGGWVRG